MKYIIIDKYILAIVCLFLFSNFSHGATVWTDWLSATAGNTGSAGGNLGAIQVAYSGQVTGNTVINGSSGIWNPDSTYVGGVIDSSPDAVGDTIGLNGSTLTNTLSFSSTIINPVIAIWSLGAPGSTASFTFDQSPNLQVGGANSIYGGSSLIVDGRVVSGNEGNGIILFEGAFDSISWTNTTENWYAFTVGQVTPVPLPASIWLFISALLGLTFYKNKKIQTYNQKATD